jgi:phosphoenolpyruvate-protein kinase (PTS system EI component)
LIVAERLTSVAALTVAALNGAAIVASGHLEQDSLSLAVARAAGVPVLCDIPGLFAWVRPDDSVLVDSDRGVLRVNPPATQIARYRHNNKG